MEKGKLGLLLTVFITFGVLVCSNSSKIDEPVVKTEAATQVGTPEVGWNNVDYSYTLSQSWAPDTNSSHVPQSGYCLLPLYPGTIADASYYETNLVTSTYPGSNIKDHILINGVEIQNVTGAIVYIYPTNGFFVYFPKEAVIYSDDYEYPTVEVLEGTTFNGTYELVATRFEYQGFLGSFGNWVVNPAPVEKKYASFYKFEWNNIDYSEAMGKSWVGERAATGAPKNGYCLLVGFKEENSEYEKTVIGTMVTEGRGVLGYGTIADTMIKVNGVNIADVVDSKCYIFPSNGLFFYIPDSSITYDDTYIRPTIEIMEGLHFNEVRLPYCKFEFTSLLGRTNGWSLKRDPSEMNHFPFVDVAGDWNNTKADATHTQTILQFGMPDVDFLKNDKTADGTNKVTKYSDCGNMITVNGVPLWKIPDANVNYAHGACYFYIYLPISALKPSNGYKIVTLHIEENTEFWDTALPDTYLYLYNNEWIKERPETPLDEDYNGAASFSDVFTKTEETLDYNHKSLPGTYEGDLERFGLFIDYKLVSYESSFSLYCLGKDDKTGFKIAFSAGTVSLYDVTLSSTLLGSAPVGTFAEDEWFSLLFFTRVNEGSLSVCVAIDDITYIHVDNVHLTDTTKIDDKFSLELGSGTASFKNAVFKGDNKKPILTYSGKETYSVLTGSEVIDLSIRCTSLDLVDGDVSNLIEYKWPEGSITEGKINHGVWSVEILSKDTSNNETKKYVTVVAKNEGEVTVTFDDKNPMIYKVGDSIAPIKDPTKQGNGNSSFRFMGWYYNDILWDFENDKILMDMNLTSKFQEVVDEYRVRFNCEGLSNINSFDLYFGYGTKVNVSMFERDGYTLTAYINDEEVSFITVKENMNVKLVYTSTNPTPKKGCNGEITSYIALTSVILGASLILLVLLKKKGEKDYE